jgi:hypothetical protein
MLLWAGQSINSTNGSNAESMVPPCTVLSAPTITRSFPLTKMLLVKYMHESLTALVDVFSWDVAKRNQHQQKKQ